MADYRADRRASRFHPHSLRNPYTELVTLLCLATGARWSEAEKLPAHRLQGNVVTYAGTKSGRCVTYRFQQSWLTGVRAHWRMNGPFTSCITSFRRALGRTTIQLPQGQASHALRHTFAGHFLDEWRQHSHASKSTRPFHSDDDNALRASISRSSTGSSEI